MTMLQWENPRVTVMFRHDDAAPWSPGQYCRKSTGKTLGLVVSAYDDENVLVLWSEDRNVDPDVAYFRKKLFAALKIPENFGDAA